jgi:hypothetical protein
MQRTKKTADILAVGLLFVLLVVAFLARSPYHITVPHRDSGIFLNIGSDVLHGKVLYQQTWDNKQPLLYVINALGLWLGNGSVWGVWGLELALLMIVFFVSYRQIRAALTPFSTFVVIAIAFLAVFPFMGGNYSEEYSLVFQVGILGLLFGMYLPNRKRLSRPAAACAIGVLVGLVFCVKQSYLDIPVTILIFMVFLAWVERPPRFLRNILLMGLGFLLVNISVFLYFQLNGALRDYVVNAFLFNLYYSRLSFIERINSLLETIKFVSSHPFFFLVASLWLGAVILLSIKTRRVYVGAMNHPYAKRVALIIALVCFTLFFVAQVIGEYSEIGLLQWIVLVTGTIFGILSLFLYLRKSGSRYPEVLDMDSLRAECLKLDWYHPGPATLLFLGLIDFPIVLFTISLSGKPWTHYYVVLFPAIILLLAGSLAYLHRFAEIPTKQVMLNSLLVAVLVTGSFPPLRQVVISLSEPAGEDARSTTAAYLKSVTMPEDTILVWGWESVIYFLAERESPTRFALPFAFYLKTPYLDEYAGILLEEVQARPPAYIADLMDAGMPLIEGRPAETCLSGNRLENGRMIDFLAFVCSHYEYDRSIETINVYKLRAGQ